MSPAVREELLRYIPQTDDPEIRARQKHATRVLLDMNPEIRKEAVDEGRLVGEKVMLRRALAGRQLALSAEQEARIDACTDRATIERWFDQALAASSAAEALQ